jgi:hypothetical protein
MSRAGSTIRVPMFDLPPYIANASSFKTDCMKRPVKELREDARSTYQLPTKRRVTVTRNLPKSTICQSLKDLYNNSR